VQFVSHPAPAVLSHLQRRHRVWVLGSLSATVSGAAVLIVSHA
jgi:hypothetical protein